ncbi:MAG: hypothetical protein HQK81_08520 [Desulfovibrionaceae bacterium]|nr:hypothetical protein [Desulfovibrionaceae bacterium]MBF0514093.1 hypothetical protein [Desulfovibrionaceae bacterium]
MSKVVALNAFRCERHGRAPALRPQPDTRPPISEVDIWGRDYAALDNVVHGILKIHQIVSHYVFPDEYWHDALLCLLDAAHQCQDGGFTRLHEASERVAGLVLLWMDEFNRKDMYAALLILSLIEKSPARKIADAAPAGS